MYTNFEDYERRINELNIQISDLQNKITQYENLINEMNDQINQLYQENQNLKAQVNGIAQYQVQPPTYKQKTVTSPNYGQQQTIYAPETQQSTQIPATQKSVTPITIQGKDTYLNKRECPKCGASGFAIKEVEDKSRLLSYVPRRIYAKKHVCTKCFYEW